MKKLTHIIWYWAPPLAWMGVIFFMSSRPHFGITNMSSYDFLIFKTLHLVEYGFLYALLFRALYGGKYVVQKKAFIFAFIIGILYAISDETHQLFVPTREGRFRDVCIDTAGMLAIYLFIRHNISLIKKYL